MRSGFQRDRRRVLSGALALTAAWGVRAEVQTPVRLIVGFAPGGSGDALGRLLADHLQLELGRPVLVENKPGAGGRIGAQWVKNAPPDGSTFLLAPDGWAIFSTLMFPPSVLRYDLLADLVPVARVASYPLALVTSGKVPVTNVREYAAWLKANPSKATYGTAGAGGQTQFIGTLIGRALGTPLTLVSYRGSGPLVTDLLGGHIPAAVLVAGNALHHPPDKIRVLAVLSDERWPQAPHLPTLKEQGYNVKVGSSWQGVWAPARTPRAEIERMQNALRKVLAIPELREAIVKSVMVTPDFMPAAQMDRELRAELAYWRQVVKDSGYKPEQ